VRVIFSPAPLLITVVVAIVMLAGFLDQVGATSLIVVGVLVGVLGFTVLSLTRRSDQPGWHHLLEGRPLLFTVLTVIAILIGGVAEIIPSLVMQKSDERTVGTIPYKPLELEGRDVYVREGCYTCHSQMIRPFLAETLRYGPRSTLADSIWDRPFQWGSKRTGPDLARIGGKYPSSWHYFHMTDPRSTSPGSNMPPYGFLSDRKIDPGASAGKLAAMQSLGVPYEDHQIAGAGDDVRTQAAAIAAELAAAGIEVDPESEMVALIAYLQSLGKQAAPPDDLAEATAKAGGQP
jgi:cytochrome c oxidase cbb3-type subunit I/II